MTLNIMAFLISLQHTNKARAEHKILLLEQWSLRIYIPNVAHGQSKVQHECIAVNIKKIHLHYT